LQETFKRVVSDDVRGGAVSLNLPTLLIYGENDTATPPRYGKLLHDAIKHSKLVILPKTGHFLHLDKPVEVENLVKDFLQ
jgi:pimeloyl-ACP methyl ester carboxylesterase